MKTKTKKILKIAVPLAIFTGTVVGVTFGAFSIAETYNKLKDLRANQEELLNKNGYDEKNLEYHQEMEELILADYRAGKINSRQFVNKLETIPDYDTKTFMTENSSAEDFQTFLDNSTTIEKTNFQHNITGILVCEGGAIGAGLSAIAFSSCFPAKLHDKFVKGEEKNEKEKEI